MLDFLLTLAVAAAAGFCLFKTKMPGGLLVGAILGVLALELSTGRAEMPYLCKFFAQSTAGAYIGSSMSREDLRGLRKVIKPLMLILGMLLLLNISAGFIIYNLGHIDLFTALMCATPGGINDVPLIAGEMGGDPGKVVIAQFSRLLVGIGIFPGLIAWYSDRVAARQSGDGPRTPIAPIKRPKAQGDLPELALTLAVAASGAWVLRMFGIPGGVLLGAILASLALRMSTGRGFLPLWAKRCAQVLSGAYVGCSMGLDDVLELRFMVVPLIIILVGYVINCFLTGHILHRFFGFSLREGMLAATPAGASDMALIAADIGIESPNLILMQVSRMLIVTLAFPPMNYAIASFYFSRFAA